jgi:hypothetical protein
MRRHQDSEVRPAVDYKLVVIIALAVLLLLGVWLQPSAAGPSDWEQQSASAASTNYPPKPESGSRGPVRLSLLDLLGKVAMAVLLVYGVGFTLSRYRLRQPQARPWRARRQDEEGHHLRVREALALPRHEGTLYLLELDGQALLVGATAQQVTVAWTPAAPDHTASFEPLRDPSPEARSGATPDFAVASPVPPRPPKGLPRAMRDESQWTQERRQLISALMRTE